MVASRGQLKLQPPDGVRGRSSFSKLVLLRAGLESASLGLLVILTSLSTSVPIANCAICNLRPCSLTGSGGTHL